MNLDKSIKIISTENGLVVQKLHDHNGRIEELYI